MPVQLTRNGAFRLEGQPKPLALLLWITLGAAAIYLTTWVGPLAFYWNFQRPLAGGKTAAEGGVVWALPVADAQSAPKAAQYKQLGGLLVPLPPGELESFKVEDVKDASETRATASLQEGKARYSVLPGGFLREVYVSECKELGVEAEEYLDEPTLLRAVFETAPCQYRFRWDTRTRMAYAARVLAKMRILPDRPVEIVATSERSEPHAVSILARYQSGETSVLAVTERGSLIVLLPKGAPPAWTASAAFWIPSPEKVPGT